jgi:lysophospholipase L1-like esterase
MDAMRPWYEDEVRALEGRVPSLAPGALLLYGSSSIRLWERLDRAFPRRRVVNHGFGGATLAECVVCFERLVRPVRPSALLLYAGDNDLANGATADRVLADFRRFAGQMASMPPIPWAVLSIKPSPSRRGLDGEIRLANRLMASEVRTIPNATFIDIHTPMMDERITPPFRYFTEDWLHMNGAGYALWAEAIRPWLAALPAPSQPAGDCRTVTGV